MTICHDSLSDQVDSDSLSARGMRTKSDTKDVSNHEVVMNWRQGRCSVLRIYEGEEDDKYNEDGEDDKYNEDGEYDEYNEDGVDAKAALDLVTQVHSERMTTVGMGRVRVLVRNKT